MEFGVKENFIVLGVLLRDRETERQEETDRQRQTKTDGDRQTVR
jgi:hypothetical protein